MLKASLGYYTTKIPDEVETYLTQLLEYSYAALVEIGVYLRRNDILSDQLQAMYAQWIYKNGGQGLDKPPMLRKAIRDWQISGAMVAAENGGDCQ